MRAFAGDAPQPRPAGRARPESGAASREPLPESRPTWPAAGARAPNVLSRRRGLLLAVNDDAGAAATLELSSAGSCIRSTACLGRGRVATIGEQRPAAILLDVGYAPASTGSRRRAAPTGSARRARHRHDRAGRRRDGRARVQARRRRLRGQALREAKLFSARLALATSGGRRRPALSVLVGASPRFRQASISRVRLSRPDINVLLEGETGTGKELVARAIHAQRSARAGPSCAVDCAALPETLIESELFGHEKGAFTGADGRRASGTSSAPTAARSSSTRSATCRSRVQAKLLRVLQERDDRARRRPRAPCTVDVRVIAATNKDLRDAVGRGPFREDLYYRLDVVRDCAPAAARARRGRGAPRRALRRRATRAPRRRAGISARRAALLEALRVAGQRARAGGGPQGRRGARRPTSCSRSTCRAGSPTRSPRRAKGSPCSPCPEANRWAWRQARRASAFAWKSRSATAGWTSSASRTRRARGRSGRCSPRCSARGTRKRSSRSCSTSTPRRCGGSCASTGSNPG